MYIICLIYFCHFMTLFLQQLSYYRVEITISPYSCFKYHRIILMRSILLKYIWVKTAESFALFNLEVYLCFLFFFPFSSLQCYFDPFSGSRFYSKAEVLHFLKSGNTYRPTSGEKRCFKASTTDNVCTLSKLYFSFWCTLFISMLTSSCRRKYLIVCLSLGPCSNWVLSRWVASWLD